jgi:hypothetical protein
MQYKQGHLRKQIIAVRQVQCFEQVPGMGSLRPAPTYAFPFPHSPFHISTRHACCTNRCGRPCTRGGQCLLGGRREFRRRAPPWPCSLWWAAAYLAHYGGRLRIWLDLSLQVGVSAAASARARPLPSLPAALLSCPCCLGTILLTQSPW